MEERRAWLDCGHSKRNGTLKGISIVTILWSETRVPGK